MAYRGFRPRHSSVRPSDQLVEDTPSQGPRDEMEELRARHLTEKEAAKRENERILDNLMERYERKEADLRQKHQTELGRRAAEEAQAQKKYQSSIESLQAQMKDEREQYRRIIEAKDKDMDGLMAQQQEDTRRIAMEKDDWMASQQKDSRTKQQAMVTEIDKLGEIMAKKEHDLLEELKNLHSQLEARTAEFKKQAELGDFFEAKARKLESELAKQAAKHNEQVTFLKDEMRGMEANFGRKTNAVAARIAEEVDRGKQQLAQEKELTARKLEDVLHELELQSTDYAKRTEQIQMQQAQELGRQQSYYEAAMAEQARSLKTKFSENAAQLQERIKSLEVDLIDKGDDFRSVSEGTLKEKYRQLRLLVETTTEPFNLGIKSYTGLGDLDPTEFLVREGKNQLRFLLRSIFWTRLMEGFFSSPYGFGAFGAGEGGSMVFNLYCTWQRLFDADFTGFGPDGPETPENHDFEAFYRNRFANGWRSATFQSIVAALRPREGSRARKRGSASRGSLSSNGLRGIAKVHAVNVEKVRADLLAVLGRVCNGAVGDEIEANVAEIVRCASELAADFAAHQAKVCFGQMPMRGDSVTIGAEFVDCEDGDTSRRGAETVDLAVSPSLFIIGDGRNDLTTPVCLLPGEIFSSKS